MRIPQPPSNLIPTRMSQLPVAPAGATAASSSLWITFEGVDYQINAADIVSTTGVPTSRQVIAGTGLTGGGALENNVTLSIASGGVGYVQLANTGITAGVYGSATMIPVMNVDAKGRVISVVNTPISISGYVPEIRQVIAGTGLTGGGALNANITISASLSDATPQLGNGSGSAGVSTSMSRSDHQHPRVDLNEGSQITNTLGLTHGGTGQSLTATPGAIVRSGVDGMYMGDVGTSGQLMQSNGVSPYSWVNQSALNVGQATNLNGGAANRVVYQTSAGVTGFIIAPTVTNTTLSWNGSTFVWSTAGAGTVQSVGLALPSEFSISQSPVTSTGTLTGAWVVQNANKLFAGPSTGVDATPSFRSMVNADLPDSGATANTYGSGTSIPVITINSKGVATGITTSTINDADATHTGFLTSTDWSTFNGKVTSVSATSPVASTGGTTPTISISQSSGSTNGYLSSTDWTTFNGKQAALVSGTNIKTVNSNSLLGAGDVSVGTVTSVSGTSPISVATGTTTPAISISQSNTSTSGYLSSTDWNTFDGKVTSVSGTSPISSTGGKTPAISITQASGSTSGYLSSTDWTTFNGKQAALGYTPVNKAGDTMTGMLTLPASTSSLIPLHLAQGTTPTTVIDGDIWFDQNGMYIKNLSAIHQLDADANAVGALSNAVITDNGNGTINVGTIDVFIYALAGWQGDYARRTVPAVTNLALTDHSQNFLTVIYNSGVPIYNITTVASNVNNSNVLLVATMWREGNMLHFEPVNWGLATATRLNDRLINIQRYTRSSGLALGESTGNVVTVGAGLVWYGVKAFAESAVTSAASNMDFYYHSAGNWTYSVVSTYNNTQYDDGTTLQTLSSNRYGVNWVYRYIDGATNPKLAIHLGGGNYSTLAAATGAAEPTPPPILTQMAILVGRIIVQKSAATATQIDSAFTSVFAGTSVTNHNDLAGLQGGAAGEYYHLTSADYTGTGTGIVVRQTSPSLTTPNIGVATGTSLAVAGTAGAGFITLVAQSSNPTAPSAGTLLIHSTTTNGFTRLEQDNEASTNLVYGRDTIFIVNNNSGGAITKGQVVYMNGTTGNIPTVGLARANSASTLPAIGVAVDAISNGAYGQCMSIGILSNVNTSVFSSNDTLYVSTATAGSFQTARPSGTTNLVQRVGKVITQNVTTGSILIQLSPFVANMETGTIASAWAINGTVTATSYVGINGGTF